MASIIIKNTLIVTPYGEGIHVLGNQALAIEGDQIVAIGDSDEISKAHKSDIIIDATSCAVLPGLIDSHIHTPLSLLRGLAQDVPEKDWMLTKDDLVIGSKLCVLEAIKSGTTCFNDYAYNMEQIIEDVYRPSGARANVCSTINELGSQKRAAGTLYQFDEEVGEKKFKDGIDLVQRWHGKLDGRITCLYGPQAADMMSANLLTRVRKQAIEDDVSLHMHIAQGGRERGQMKERYGLSTVEYLKGIDYIDTRLIAVHCHDTSDEEIKILAEAGARMVGCPGSIGLIDGVVPPLHAFTAAGGIASLGSDQGPPDGSTMFSQMKYAAILNKTLHRDPTVMPAQQVFRMATLDAARCHVLDRTIGSLEVGKKADIIIVALDYPSLTPTVTLSVQNIIPNLVYYATGAEVRDVIINGELVKQNGEMITLNERQILSESQRAAERLIDRALDDLKDANSPYLAID
ncbi:MAG: amidohydrolase family protein [Candidatus Thorarchaeota archaeon]|jgi:5-methylthioadenosine/S-adenosylhomocysteine deaminase